MRHAKVSLLVLKAMDLDYHRVFSNRPSPRWLMPVGPGTQVR